jgi:ribulose-5-phosphate 4-epimerase/fuculose-1-phosphate aldolase
MTTVTSFDTYQPDVSKSEWETRVAVAASYRLLAHYRLSDLSNGFIAARIPGEPDYCITGRFGMFSEEATASGLLKMSIHHTDDVELEVDVAGAAAPLFQSVFQARDDVNCVIHTHTKATETLSCLGAKILPISHPGLVLCSQTGYVDYAYHHDAPFCKTMVEAFEGNRCILLGNHGMIAVGRTAADAFFCTFTFDQACLIQLEAYQSGREIMFPDNVDEMMACYTTDYTNNSETGYSWDGKQEWGGWLRMMDQKDPSYKN